MVTSTSSDLPDVDSELFEQVTDDELALLECYRALPEPERAAALEALVGLVAQIRQAQRRPRGGRNGAWARQET